MDKEKNKDKDFLIIVNATEQSVDDETITFAQVVDLAFPSAPTGPNIVYSVTFEHAKNPKQGTLAEGGSVVVKKRNTIFDVTQTNRA